MQRYYTCEIPADSRTVERPGISCFGEIACAVRLRENAHPLVQVEVGIVAIEEDQTDLVVAIECESHLPPLVLEMVCGRVCSETQTPRQSHRCLNQNSSLGNFPVAWSKS